MSVLFQYMAVFSSYPCTENGFILSDWQRMDGKGLRCPRKGHLYAPSHWTPTSFGGSAGGEAPHSGIVSNNTDWYAAMYNANKTKLYHNLLQLLSTKVMKLVHENDLLVCDWCAVNDPHGHIPSPYSIRQSWLGCPKSKWVKATGVGFIVKCLKIRFQAN